MGILDKIKGQKQPDPLQRRRRLLQIGRITDGEILDARLDENGREMIVFVYTLNGVDFESADVLTEEQKQQRERYFPGAKVSVRFDPKNQYDSIVE